MPKVVVEIPNSEKFISRPIVYDIVRDLMKRTFFPYTNKIYFNGDINSPLQPGSSINDSDISGDKIIATDNASIIEVTEEYLDDSLWPTTVDKGNQPLIFLDEKLGVSLRPVLSRVRFNITVSARFDSKSKANAWRNVFRTATAAGRITLNHNVNFSYILPRVLLALFYDIHTKMERKEGYGITVQDWVKEHITNRATTLTALSGENPELGITERYANITGNFDFSGQPDPIENNLDKNVYEASYNYTFDIDKPISIIAKYPIMAHNSFLDKKFIIREPRYSLNEESPRASQTTINATAFTTSYPGYTVIEGLSVPYYDDWLPIVDLPSVFTIARLLIMVDEDDPTNVINISELGSFDNWEFSLDEDLLEYISDSPGNILVKKNSPFYVALYENDHIVSDLTIDISGGDLTIRTEEDLNLRSVYHIVFYFLYDLTILRDFAKESLRSDGVFATKLLKSLFPGIEDKTDPAWWKIRSDGSLSKFGFMKLIEWGKMYFTGKNMERHYAAATIMNFTINAKSRG